MRAYKPELPDFVTTLVFLCGKFLGSVLGIILELNLDFIFDSGIPCSICSGGVSVQSIFAVSALWVLWPLLWILDVVMQHFSFCRMIISLDLAAGFFLLSCWRGVWEEVAGCVSGVMTFSWCRLTGGVNWQHTPAVASILTKLCLLLINLAGAIGKKQDLQEPGFGWGGQYCTCSSCAGGHSMWGAVLAVGFNILVYIAMPAEVRCVCV